MRRRGERIDPNQSYRKRPGAYGLIVSGRSALLTLSMDEDAGPQLPGGGIDPGENPLQALHREVMEETGWRIAPIRRIGVYQRFNFLPEYGFWAQKICSIYLCHPVQRISAPTEPLHAPLWADIALLPELLIDPSQASFVAEEFLR